MKSEQPTLLDQLGGETALRRIIDRFLDQVFTDPLIGFFFAQADQQRVRDKEFEFAAMHLGGARSYSGRPLAVAHAQHPITGGHFMRRLQILKETLDEFDVPSSVKEHWVAHTERMRSQVTEQKGSDCGAAGVFEKWQPWSDES